MNAKFRILILLFAVPLSVVQFVGTALSQSSPGPRPANNHRNIKLRHLTNLFLQGHQTKHAIDGGIVVGPGRTFFGRVEECLVVESDR